MDNSTFEREFEELTNVFWSVIDLKSVTPDNSHLIVSYLDLFEQLKIIAKNNKISLDKSDYLDGCFSKFKMIHKTNLNDDISREELNSQLDECRDLHEDVRRYIANFTSKSGDLFDIINNPELLSDYELKKRQFEENDRVFDIYKPMQISDGEWDDFDAPTRLETLEEVKQRVQSELKIRKEILNASSKQPKDSQLKSWLEFFVALPKLSQMYKILGDRIVAISKQMQQLELQDFYRDNDFIQNANKLISHDTTKFEYLYHGAQCVQDAMSIAKQGLFMARQELATTTYSEMDLEQILTYSRGFDGTIGSAMVVIKKPIDEQIVDKIKDESLQFCQSGLGGFSKPEYIIPKEYIVGYIDKVNHEVCFNEQALADDISNEVI